MSMTMKGIADLAGVSRYAVSAVLSNSKSTRVSAETREKILRLAEKYDFVPNHAAQQLKGYSTQMIGLISPSPKIGFISVLQAELVTLLQSKGFDVLINQVSPENRDFDAKLKELRARRVEGVLALNVHRPSGQPEKTALPIVYFSGNTSGCPDIDTDRVAGGCMAGKHLLEHGRKNPVYVYFTGNSVPNQEKFNGFSMALKEYGCGSPDKHILALEYGIQPSEAVIRLRKMNADAIFCCNDYVAAKMMRALLQAGFRIPQDMAIIGFDGYAFCDFTPVSLATVVQPVKKQAEAAVELLLGRIGRNVVDFCFANLRFTPELRPSESCGCPDAEANELSGLDNLLLMNSNN